VVIWRLAVITRLGNKRGQRGFTLMELLIVMAIIGILVSTAALVYRHSVTKAREAALKQDLYHMRECINQYNADRGKYPPSLNSLVEAGYLRAVPVDPFTDTNESWVELEYQPRDEEDEDSWGGGGYGNDDYNDDSYDDYNDYDSVWGDDEYDTGPGIWDVRTGHKGAALDGSSYEEW
jgi:general secretion pathway protein G